MPLPLRVKGKEVFNYVTEEFFQVPTQDIELEHCLLAISRWESKWKKSFVETFGGKNKTPIQEVYSYIQFMSLDENVDKNFVYCLEPKQTEQIIKYMTEEQTATTITHGGPTPPKSNEILTSELIYYYMSQVPLPFKVCERWHFSRLLKILEIASIKSQPDKKMNPKSWGSKQAALNAARRAKMGSLG